MDTANKTKDLIAATLLTPIRILMTSSSGLFRVPLYYRGMFHTITLEIGTMPDFSGLPGHQGVAFSLQSMWL